jgi:hypothetical protein
MRFRRFIWKLRRYRWYFSVLGVREFNRKILPSTTLGRFIFGEKSLRDSKNAPPEPQYVAPDDSLRFAEPPSNQIRKPLNLKAGDWVEVKSAKEIFATLDHRNKHRGLSFTQEMMKFCGRRLKVFRVLEKICIETTGELRTMKTPTVLLEGAICDGEFHGGCTRSCFHFWREDWLRRSQPPGVQDSKSGDV